jgi:hypothetical protein
MRFVIVKMVRKRVPKRVFTLLPSFVTRETVQEVRSQKSVQRVCRHETASSARSFPFVYSALEPEWEWIAFG